MILNYLNAFDLFKLFNDFNDLNDLKGSNEFRCSIFVKIDGLCLDFWNFSILRNAPLYLCFVVTLDFF
jgi:hypothetical protein